MRWVEVIREGWSVLRNAEPCRGEAGWNGWGKRRCICFRNFLNSWRATWEGKSHYFLYVYYSLSQMPAHQPWLEVGCCCPPSLSSPGGGWLILHIPAVLGSAGVGEIAHQKNNVYWITVKAELNWTLWALVNVTYELSYCYFICI